MIQIACDVKNCESVAQQPYPGAVPDGWGMITAFKEVPDPALAAMPAIVSAFGGLAGVAEGVAEGLLAATDQLPKIRQLVEAHVCPKHDLPPLDPSRFVPRRAPSAVGG